MFQLMEVEGARSDVKYRDIAFEGSLSLVSDALASLPAGRVSHFGIWNGAIC